MAADVIRVRSSQRIAATIFAVGWFFAAGGTIVLMAWMNLWVLVGLAAVTAVAVEVLVVRAASVRLVLEPERITVANHIRTHRLARSQVADFDVVRWTNPTGEYVTVALVLVDGGEPVRVEASAVHDGNQHELDPVLDRLDDWRFRRR
ncbi:MAG: hypothetical protein ACOYMR_00335 [Ilumatobacteraceae bacterium]